MSEEIAMSKLYAEGDEGSQYGESGEESGEEEGSSETGSGSSSGSSEEEDEDESEGEDEEEDEPVLKYRRFAKDVVGSISTPGMDHAVYIRCIAVHSKVK